MWGRGSAGEERCEEGEEVGSEEAVRRGLAERRFHCPLVACGVELAARRAVDESAEHVFRVRSVRQLGSVEEEVFWVLKAGGVEVGGRGAAEALLDVGVAIRKRFKVASANRTPITPSSRRFFLILPMSRYHLVWNGVVWLLEGIRRRRRSAAVEASVDVMLESRFVRVDELFADEAVPRLLHHVRLL